MGEEENLVRTGRKLLKDQYLIKSHPKTRADAVLAAIHDYPGDTATDHLKEGRIKKSDAAYFFLLEEQGRIAWSTTLEGWVAL